MAIVDDEKRARRRARVVVSDILQYHDDLVNQGVENDNLFDLLGDHIEEERANYEKSVTPEMYSKNFFGRALVDLLVKYKGHIKSPMW